VVEGFELQLNSTSLHLQWLAYVRIGYYTPFNGIPFYVSL